MLPAAVLAEEGAAVTVMLIGLGTEGRGCPHHGVGDSSWKALVCHPKRLSRLLRRDAVRVGGGYFSELNRLTYESGWPARNSGPVISRLPAGLSRSIMRLPWPA